MGKWSALNKGRVKENRPFPPAGDFLRYEAEKKKLCGLRGAEYESAIRRLAKRMRL